MTTNPYQPTSQPDSPGRGEKWIDRQRPDWRTALSHVFGVATLLTGFGSFWTVLTMPTGHPAYGGPNIASLIAVIVNLFFLCLTLAAIVTLNAIIAKSWKRLLYLIPAAGFVVYVLGGLFWT